MQINLCKNKKSLAGVIPEALVVSLLCNKSRTPFTTYGRVLVVNKMKYPRSVHRR